ncbi:hypothetical protein QBC43DRAFT_355375 [Cladorrhinum sp. PSN259]|nr:hypothetical protein QBC43DRAFT_355375 [Cladorrhinum sp. PSN259]
MIIWLVFADQDHPASEQASKVGWENGARRRGTLGLLYQCLTTIAVCTWTVLHLNVLALANSTQTRTLRQAKWMVVNILFPEFLFAKAICDLRLALHHLFSLAELVQQRPDAFRWKSVTDADNDIDLEMLEGDESTNLSETRIWTLIHSYYANMGGIQAPGREILAVERSGRRLRWETRSENVEVVRGDDFLPTHGTSDADEYFNLPPLKQLDLSHRDIEDKSKFDWFAKTVAICQITWLVLYITTRRSTGLPVTQLEIATLSFYVLALCTYAVNWGKPRDIMIPTVLRIPIFRDGKQHQSYQVQSLISSLWHPSSDDPALDRISDDRVSSDSVWMEGCTSAIQSNLGTTTQFPSAGWDLLEKKHTALGWDTKSWGVFINSTSTRQRDWSTRPPDFPNVHFSARQKIDIRNRRAAFAATCERMREFRQECLAPTERKGQLGLRVGNREMHDNLLFYANNLQLGLSGYSQESEQEATELCLSHERHLRDSISLKPLQRERLPNICCRKHITTKINEHQEHIARAERLRRRCDRVARIVTLIGGVLGLSERFSQFVTEPW